MSYKRELFLFLSRLLSNLAILKLTKYLYFHIRQSRLRQRDLLRQLYRYKLSPPVGKQKTKNWRTQMSFTNSLLHERWSVISDIRQKIADHYTSKQKMKIRCSRIPGEIFNSQRRNSHTRLNSQETQSTVHKMFYI